MAPWQNFGTRNNPLPDGTEQTDLLEGMMTMVHTLTETAAGVRNGLIEKGFNETAAEHMAMDFWHAQMALLVSASS